MKKSKTDKRVNKIVRKINKQLKEDVFGNRFWVKQVAKQKGETTAPYYLYELKDRLEPERDSILNCGWLWGDSHFFASSIYEEVNNFIVLSDFWSIYWNDKSRYDKEQDIYLSCLVNKI